MSRNQKIVAITLTILTLCIPLIVERIVHALVELCKGTQANRQSEGDGRETLQETTLSEEEQVVLQHAKDDFREALQETTLGEAEQIVLQRAHEIFSSNSFVQKKAFELGPGVLYDQPLNQAIPLLNRIFHQKRDEIKLEIFNVQSRNENPWENRNIVSKADDLISLAFAIEYFMIKELDAFTSHYQISQGKAFASGNSYHFQALAYLPLSYEMKRDRWIIAETGKTERDAGVQRFVFRNLDTPSAPDEAFYLARCERLRQSLDIESIRAEDHRALIYFDPTYRSQSPPIWF